MMRRLGFKGQVHAAAGALGCALLAGSALAAQTVVATVDEQAISAEQLKLRAAAKLDGLQADYESRLRQLNLSYERSRQENQERELNALVDEQVLSREAKARHQTADELVAATAPPGVSEAEVRSFYDGHRGEINRPYDLVAPKIKDYLNQNAAGAARSKYLAQLRKKYRVAILLEPRRETVAATGPARGPSDAPVTLVEFSDFQCPFCGRFEPVIKQVLAKYGTQVRLVYRNFPLASLHPDAQKAAEAGVCAQKQGKFWQLHDSMFADQAALGIVALKDKARRAGLEAAPFDACLDSGEAKDAVAADIAAGDELGIQGTPATLINGRFISGSVTEAELTSLIDDELRRAHRL